MKRLLLITVALMIVLGCLPAMANTVTTQELVPNLQIIFEPTRTVVERGKEYEYTASFTNYNTHPRKITPVPCLPDCHIVLAKPAASLSTRLVYQEYDQNPSELHPFTGEVLEAMEKNNLGNICTRMFNVMEETAKRLCPEITNTQRIISDFSPMGMCMSGSGPTTFAIFDSEDVAQECRKALLGSRVEAHVVTPVRKIIIRKSV